MNNENHMAHAPLHRLVGRFYGHCHKCRHYNTCNLSMLPEGGCVNWEKP
jgi:hypothetical protein